MVLPVILAAQIQGESDELLMRDRDLARDLLQDRTSVMRYSEGRFAVVNSDVLQEYFSGRRPFSRLTLRPEKAEIVSTHHLAFTTGGYDYTSRYARCNCSASEHGTYMTVWTYSKKGWRAAAFIPSVEKAIGCGCSR